QVRNHFTDRGHGAAPRDSRRRDRREAKRCARHAAAGEADHRRRGVDAEHLVAGGDEVLGGDAAAASELDDPPAADAVGLQQSDDARCSARGELAEPGVVDESEVGRIHAAYYRTDPKIPASGHSERSALAGSTMDARRAGTRLAAVATASSSA